MRDALVRKHHRRQAILRLVSERRLATQDELARALRGAGFEATQATVSRDILELGLVKVARDGRHSYAPPEAVTPGAGLDRLRRFCEDYPVTSMRAAGVVVLRSLPGTANALGAALDAAAFPEVVGTIAGDDTVFAAVEDDRAARALLRRLSEFGILEQRRRG